MDRRTLRIVEFKETSARFQIDDRTGHVGLDLYPTNMAARMVPHRKALHGSPEINAIPDIGPASAAMIDSLVHVKIVGDPYPGAFAQGRTMRASASVGRFKYQSQEMITAEGKTTVRTVFRSSDGLWMEHRLSWRGAGTAVEVEVELRNESANPVILELLSSFSLGGITPFDSADAPGRLRVHRFRSVWSAEARLDTQSIEQLHLERSWTGGAMLSERFGQVGSMPVRGWFPFLAVEDSAAGVLWGAQLAWAGSWQMEIFRQHDELAISGGLADREFGQWTKILAVGESVTTPPATLACVQGSLDDLCDRLTAMQQRAADLQPAVERDLPIIFNEWCTSWGSPSHDGLVRIARRLGETHVKYMVIDAGWYKADLGDWSRSHGDWKPSSELFPRGLEATAVAIREQGLIPGLWFEMETVGDGSAAFSLVEHLLHRDGVPLTVGRRRFWDMNDPWVVDYLTQRVIGLLESCGFGYLKVDYNETIGIGSDDPQSLGEGLRRQVCGVYRFFERIRRRLPDLVIENCASGGHRLEPSMLALSSMSSFSDAHELVEIPIIAANLHRLMLPRQSQVWAVLRAADSEKRLIYSLAATFLGRMCLSGEIDHLTGPQWHTITRAQEMYGRAAPIIKHGTSRRFGQIAESWRHPAGWQGVVRTNLEKSAALVVVHTFSGAPRRLEIPLPVGGGWAITDRLVSAGTTTSVSAQILSCETDGDFSACAALLNRRNAPDSGLAW